MRDALQKVPGQKCCCSFIMLNRERWCLSSLPPPGFGALAQLVTAFWPRGGNGEAARAPSQCSVIQMGNRGMDVLCRNPTHWLHPLEGKVTSRPASDPKGHQRGAGTLLQTRAGRVVQGRRDVPGHPITNPAWSCHLCRGFWGVLFERSLLEVSLTERVGVQSWHPLP